MIKSIDFLIKNYLVYVITLFSFGVLIYNVLFYDPIEGYDAESHYNYIYYISMYLPKRFVLPGIENTREFFNPPVPYLFPAFVQVICRNLISSNDYISDCRLALGTTTQIFQSVLYILSFYFYLITFKLLKNSKKTFNLNLVLMISILAVNYRTFSMIRGEPYIIFFNSMLLYLFLTLIKKNYTFQKKDIIFFGLLIGLIALSRQWSFLLMPGYFLVIKSLKNASRKQYFKFISLSFIFGFLVSSWFYFSLYYKYGSFTAFNLEPENFSFFNQPLDFYFPFNNEASMIFSKPIRPYFSNQVIPILYSDLWGDYWGYFVFTSRDLVSGLNQLFIGDYLARVNLISLVPTSLMLFSAFRVKNLKGSKTFHQYILISVLITFVGYLWFLISYPQLPTGDTIKSTYIIQLFHLLAFLSASFLEDIEKSNNKKYLALITLLLFAYIHNFSTYLSHFPFKF